MVTTSKGHEKLSPLVNIYEPDYRKFTLFLLFLYVGTFLLQANDRISILGAVRFEFCLGIILIILSFTTKAPYANSDTKNVIGAVFFLYIIFVISFIFSINPSHSWDLFFNRVIKFSFLALFLARLASTTLGLKVFFAAFILACLKMGQEGMLGQITGSLVWENQGIMRLHGSTAMYRHPNSFSGMAVGTLPFIFYLYPLGNKYVKLTLLGLLLGAITVILFTGSRTGYIAFFGFLILVFYKSTHKLKIIVALLLLTLFAFPFIPEQYKGRFKSIYSGEEAEGKSKEGRIHLLYDALSTISEHPLGIGIDSFQGYQITKGRRPQDTHNLYTQVLTNIGLQGGIAFGILLASIISLQRRTKQKAYKLINEKIPLIHSFRSPLPSTKNQSNEELNELISRIKFVIVAIDIAFLYLTTRLILGFFGHDLYEIYWWVVVGITVAASNIINSIYIEISKDIEKLKNRKRDLLGSIT